MGPHDPHDPVPDFLILEQHENRKQQRQSERRKRWNRRANGVDERRDGSRLWLLLGRWRALVARNARDVFRYTLQQVGGMPPTA